jgi:uncharacterized protein YbjQ (UPF0145 family)
MIQTSTPAIEGMSISRYHGVVVGIDIDYETVGPDGGMLMDSVSGTAVTAR